MEKGDLGVRIAGCLACFKKKITFQLGGRDPSERSRVRTSALLLSTPQHTKRWGGLENRPRVSITKGGNYSMTRSLITKKGGQKGSGVSLLEVVVALGVLSIISAIVVPIFQNYRNEALKKTCHRNFAMVQETMRSYAAFNRIEINGPLGWSWFIAENDAMAGSRLLGSSAKGCDYPTRWYTFRMVVPPVGVAYIDSCGSPTMGSHPNPANTTGW